MVGSLFVGVVGGVCSGWSVWGGCVRFFFPFSSFVVSVLLVLRFPLVSLLVGVGIWLSFFCNLVLSCRSVSLFKSMVMAREPLFVPFFVVCGSMVLKGLFACLTRISSLGWDALLNVA